jgi:hypothetical protein
VSMVEKGEITLDLCKMIDSTEESG